jgi:hypothetical protein
VSAQLSIVEGPGKYKSVYLNGYRIAGIKPWGGGKTILNFDVKEEDIMKALDTCKSCIKIISLSEREEEVYDCPIHGKLDGIGECPLC